MEGKALHAIPPRSICAISERSAQDEDEEPTQQEECAKHQEEPTTTGLGEFGTRCDEQDIHITRWGASSNNPVDLIGRKAYLSIHTNVGLEGILRVGVDPSRVIGDRIAEWRLCTIRGEALFGDDLGWSATT